MARITRRCCRPALGPPAHDGHYRAKRTAAPFRAGLTSNRSSNLVNTTTSRCQETGGLNSRSRQTSPLGQLSVHHGLLLGAVSTAIGVSKARLALEARLREEEALQTSPGLVKQLTGRLHFRKHVGLRPARPRLRWSSATAGCWLGREGERRTCGRGLRWPSCRTI